MNTLAGFLLLLLAAPGLTSNSNRDSGVPGIKYQVQKPPLTTPWTQEAGIDPWPEYPRPQLQRSQWKSLNGIWRYQNASSLLDISSLGTEPATWREVLVPSCLESGLSGIQGNNTITSWLATSFNVSDRWLSAEQRVLLNFGAVDYEATVFINRKKAGFHRGGYFEFTVDATPYLTPDGQANELLVFVYDPTDSDDNVIPIGKQTLQPNHLFYTPCSGIWQNVWIEAAPANYIVKLDVEANMHGDVNVTVHTSNSTNPETVEVTIFDQNSDKALTTQKGPSDQSFEISVQHPKLWSPESPNLYNVTVTLGKDQVQSYLGFRSVSRDSANGVVRPFLNNKPIFIFGTLDQGYWPDGIYTPPNREAMTYDLHVLKRLGFNAVRKHVKVEPGLFYRTCDELGLLVIQDMPALRPLQTETEKNNCTEIDILPNEEQQVEFGRQLELLVNQLKNYPSIIAWVVYNEGWGQIVEEYYPEFGLTDRVKRIDPSRLVDSTSGWHDHGAGDFSDNHHYASPQCGTPFYSADSRPFDPKRIGFQGEFGGLGNNASIEHLWDNQNSINTINQTYEIDQTIDVWNYRSNRLLSELKDQITRFSCAGAIWTQTADVEGELNGIMTYDRRVLRSDESQWKRDIRGLYDAAKARF